METTQRVEIPSALLWNLMRPVGRLNGIMVYSPSPAIMQSIARQAGIAVDGELDEAGWNQTINWLDAHYPNFRDFRVDSSETLEVA